MPWQLHPITAFARFAPRWDRLADAAGGAPFLTSRFLTSLLSHFAAGGERLACLAEGDEIRAMALIVRRSYGVWETFQPSQLPLGPWVMLPGEDLATCARTLLRRLPGFALRLGITQLDPAMYARPADGRDVETLDYVETAFVEIEGAFEDFWSARGKNLRTNMRKQRRKLAADGVAVGFEVLTRPGEMAEAIESYGRLEAAGWKAARGTAIEAENAQGRFYRAMLEAFCNAGYGRVYRLRFGDRVVAVDLCIEGNGVEVVLKTTYDETAKSLSPASLMREDEMREHFAGGRVRRVEFFGKVMDWHTHWTGNSRLLYHVNVNRFSWLSRVRGLLSRRSGSSTVIEAP